MDNKLTIQEFVLQQKKLIEKFERMWLKGAKEDPDDWPIELSASDWDSQLETFASMLDEAERLYSILG